MEWVETTGTTIEEAKAAALDRLGVDESDAEFEVVEEPKAGLFGRTRGEARVRARIKQSPVRKRSDKRERKTGADRNQAEPQEKRPPRRKTPNTSNAPVREAPVRPEMPPVDPSTVSSVAASFLQGLIESAGVAGSVQTRVEGEIIDIDVLGDDLGFLVGSKGVTLMALQDLTRVVSQRRLGDHETRLRVDVAGYREKRREALGRFAKKVAVDVMKSGQARALEPMNSADRKIVHDTLATVEGIATRSEGSEPFRRVVVALASVVEDVEEDLENN